MNTRMIGFLLGRILMVEAGLLALPLLTALLYGEPLMPWLATMLVLAAIGGALSLREAGTHRHSMPRTALPPWRWCGC